MVDWVVILTPLLVLGVLLLLGYAGCDFDASGPPLHFDIGLWVTAEPSGDDHVTNITYTCRPPNGPMEIYGDPNPTPDQTIGSGTNAPVNLYVHRCGADLEAGTWNAGCAVTVDLGTTGAVVQASGEATVEADADHTARFSAEQTPGGGFTVMYLGTT